MRGTIIIFLFGFFALIKNKKIKRLSKEHNLAAREAVKNIIIIKTDDKKIRIMRPERGRCVKEKPKHKNAIISIYAAK
jgi:hypothetical protein